MVRSKQHWCRAARSSRRVIQLQWGLSVFASPGHTVFFDVVAGACVFFREKFYRKRSGECFLFCVRNCIRTRYRAMRSARI